METATPTTEPNSVAGRLDKTLDRFRALEAQRKADAIPQAAEQAKAGAVSYEDHIREKEFPQRFSSSNVPRRHRERSKFEGDEWQAAMDSISAKLGTGCLVALIGERGNGKTQMAVELIRQSCRAGRESRYCNAMEIFLEIKATYRTDSKESERDVIRHFASPQLLVIDEIHERGETQWEDRLLTYIIDKRYQAEQDTVVIANLKEAEFSKSMGPSIVSRLIETGGIVHCDWPSYRK